jgi:hypothetical protein
VERQPMVWIGLRERGVVLLGGGRRINYLGVYFFTFSSQRVTGSLFFLKKKIKSLMC